MKSSGKTSSRGEWKTKVGGLFFSYYFPFSLFFLDYRQTASISIQYLFVDWNHAFIAGDYSMFWLTMLTGESIENLLIWLAMGKKNQIIGKTRKNIIRKVVLRKCLLEGNFVHILNCICVQKQIVLDEKTIMISSATEKTQLIWNLFFWMLLIKHEQLIWVSGKLFMQEFSANFRESTKSRITIWWFLKTALLISWIWSWKLSWRNSNRYDNRNR